jgi:hypothetical protein
MNERHPQDEWVRKKLAERTHPFDPAHWAGAEALLDADRRRRRFFWWFWGGGGAAAAALLLVWGLSGRLERAGHPLAADSASLVAPPPAGAGLQSGTGKQAAETAPEASLPISGVLDAAAQAAPGPAPSPSPLPAASPALRDTPAAPPSLSDLYRLDPPSHRLALSVAGEAGPWQELPEAAKRRHSLAFYSGLGLARGWSNGKEAAPSSLHPHAGLLYGFQVSPALRLQLGLGYAGRGGLNSDSAYRSIYYGFGYRWEDTLVSPRRLHQVELPLFADLRLHRRLSLQAGLRASWLLQVSGRVYYNVYSDGAAELDAQGRPAWGYRQGFRRLDAAPLLGLGYYLGKGWQLSAQAQWGTRDLSDPAFFRNRDFDRDVQFRLTLSRSLRPFTFRKS